MFTGNYEKNKAVPFAVHNTCASNEEKRKAAAYYKELLEKPQKFPCSFELNGELHKGFEKDFTFCGRTHEENEYKQTDVLKFRHKSGLVFRILMACYPEYAAVEWTLYLKNENLASASMQISNLHAADMILEGINPHLQGIIGDALYEESDNTVISPTGWMNNQPYDRPLYRNVPYELKCKDGCSSNYEFPYFSLQMEDHGVLLAIGWPGQWTVRMKNQGESTSLWAGQEYLDTYLYSKEEIRTPMITMLFYDGNNRDRQTNLWRHFFMDCNMPRKNGLIPQPMMAGASCGTALMVHATEENQIEQIREIRKAGVKLDCWWMDAGWYTTDPQGNAPKTLNEYGYTGTWEVREKDFPTHLRAITECMEEEGGITLLWFEPERCGLFLKDLKEDGSTLKKEWMLNDYSEFHLDEPKGRDLVLPVSFVNLGNEQAYEWIRDRIFKVLEEGKISIYREDHNIRPLKAFLNTDEKVRKGMTENKYITAHIRLWDELRENFDEMLIDSCASGGRRNDLESMRRAVPLWYTDFFRGDITKLQAIQQSLYAWFPYFMGNGFIPAEREEDTYYMRTSMTPHAQVMVDVPNMTEEKQRRMRQYYEEWKSVNHLFYADFYAVIPWNIDESQWIGNEFVDSVTGEGFLQLYRRPYAAQTCQVLLKGLKEDARYELEVAGMDERMILSGKELMEDGYTAEILQAPGAVTVRFQKVND